MDNTEVQTVETTIHGRYLVRRGDPSRLLLGFHGYAESAERHLSELSSIPGADEWTVVAIQALHRFYNLKTGDVVASWMTKQDRELAIQDNLSYVRNVIARMTPGGTVVFAGFSQGASMAWRAAAAIQCHGVIVLGGDVPPDVSAQTSGHLPRVLVGRGVRDEWYTDEKLRQDLSFLQSYADAVETSIFDGGHEWTDEFRAAASEFLKTIY
ncbi:MAG: phospholipase [Acidobacteriota bacterium]